MDDMTGLWYDRAIASSEDSRIAGSQS